MMSNFQNMTSIKYWHVWVGNGGCTHQSYKEIPVDLPAKSWNGLSSELKISAVETDIIRRQFIVLEPSSICDWHTNPVAQWIIPLSGKWFVETLDGVRVEMGPGEISYGEDQDSGTIDGKIGHLSGTVNKEPCVLLLLQTQ